MNVILNASGANNYTWSANAGSAATASVSVSPLSTSVYTVSGSSSGCVSSQTVTVTVNPSPVISIGSSASSTLCAGQGTTLTASGAANYTWSVNAGSSTSASVSIAPAVTTIYTVSGSNGNCLSSQTIAITVNQIPSPPVLVDTTIYYCLHQPVSSLTASVTSGATLAWYNAVGIALPGAPVPSTSVLGSTAYYLTQSIGNCISARDSIKIVVLPAPDAFFSTSAGSNPVLNNQPISFNPSQQSASSIFSWNFDETGSNSNASSLITPWHTYANGGIYCPKLVITSVQTGCRDSSLLCIEVLTQAGIIVPNIFTPNNDQVNDVFSLKLLGIKHVKCTIYDRWGLMLYSWTDLSGHWDGNDKDGKAAREGTYYYVIEAVDLLGKTLTYKGFVELIR